MWTTAAQLTKENWGNSGRAMTTGNETLSYTATLNFRRGRVAIGARSTWQRKTSSEKDSQKCYTGGREKLYHLILTGIVNRNRTWKVQFVQQKPLRMGKETIYWIIHYNSIWNSKLFLLCWLILSFTNLFGVWFLSRELTWNDFTENQALHVLRARSNRHS